MLLPYLAAQLAQRIEGQRAADSAGESAHNLPILARLSGRKYRTPRQLHAALGIGVAAILLSIGGARKDDIGATGTTVTVMALVNDKGSSEIARINLVGAEQVENLDVARFASGDDAAHIAAARSRHKAEIKAADSCGGVVQDIEPVPILANEPSGFGNVSRRS